jgi:hypothetical protein
MKLLIVLAMLAGAFGVANGQPGWINRPPPGRQIEEEQSPATLTYEIRVELAPLDSDVVRFGVTESELLEALTKAAEVAGWRVNAGAEYVVTAVVAPAQQRQEDLTTFKITVATSSSANRPMESAGGPGLTALVDLPAGSTAKLVTHASDLTTRLTRQLWRDVKKRQMMELRMRNSRRNSFNEF